MAFRKGQELSKHSYFFIKISVELEVFGTHIQVFLQPSFEAGHG